MWLMWSESPLFPAPIRFVFCVPLLGKRISFAAKRAAHVQEEQEFQKTRQRV